MRIRTQGVKSSKLELRTSVPTRMPSDARSHDDQQTTLRPSGMTRDPFACVSVDEDETSAARRQMCTDISSQVEDLMIVEREVRLLSRVCAHSRWCSRVEVRARTRSVNPES